MATILKGAPVVAAMNERNTALCEQLKAKGINDSIIHVDFMVGCKELSITGYTRDGKAVKIFEQGNWAI